MTQTNCLATLPHRGVVRVAGADVVPFLQGLISNDVKKVGVGSGIYAALLTPQGKFLHDLFVVSDGADGFLLDCERGRAADLIQRLTAYRLRAKVTLSDLSAQATVQAAWADTPPVMPQDAIAIADPRRPELGWRIVTLDQPPAVPTAELAEYDRLRLTVGVADGSRDLEIEKSTLAEGNFDHLNGVDWKKGCYVGQELTARMHYRGLAKRRLFPVKIGGQGVEATAILQDGGEVGQLRSRSGDRGLALLPIELVAGDVVPNLTCGGAVVTPRWPDWLPRPESKASA